MKSIHLLLLLLLLWRDTLAGASKEVEQFWQVWYHDEFVNTTNGTNITAVPDVTVGDGALYTPKNGGDTSESPLPGHHFLPPTRAPSFCHSSIGPSIDHTSSLSGPDISFLHSTRHMSSFIFVDPLKAMSYFTLCLNLHRMVEQFLPTQFNLWRREAHRDFSTIMSSFEQQLVVNNL